MISILLALILPIAEAKLSDRLKAFHGIKEKQDVSAVDGAAAPETAEKARGDSLRQRASAPETATPIKPSPQKTPELLGWEDKSSNLFPSTFPLYVGGSPQPEASFYLTYQKNLWAGLEISLTPLEYEKIPELYGIVSGLKSLDPLLKIGLITPTHKSEWGFFYIAPQVNFDNFYVKATLYNQNFSAVKESEGFISLGYRLSGKNLLSKKDLLKFYFGWSSPALQVDLTNIESFKKAFGSVDSHLKRGFLGVYYNPDIASSLSFSLEFSQTAQTLSVGFFL